MRELTLDEMEVVAGGKAFDECSRMSSTVPCRRHHDDPQLQGLNDGSATHAKFERWGAHGRPIDVRRNDPSPAPAHPRFPARTPNAPRSA